MGAEFKQIRIKGKQVAVPAIGIENRTIVAKGKWVKIATIHDENWVEGEAIKDPAAAIAKLCQENFKADLLTFAQRVPDLKPKFNYPIDWDNVAAITLSSYLDWWENRVPQETRKNTRRSAKRGVTVRVVSLDDRFIQGVTDIYNETPIRQGKPFPKYGQDFETVKKDVSQLADRSDFIGAYFGEELIGFVKLVYLGNKVASILSINSKNQHFDKRPTNILMSRTVEICCEKGMTHLLYGRYTYGNKSASPLTEFKRRNGFEKVLVPRYFIPLTLKGRLVLMLNMHQGLIAMLPGGLVDFLVKVRAFLFKKKAKTTEVSEQDNQPARDQMQNA